MQTISLSLLSVLCFFRMWGTGYDWTGHNCCFQVLSGLQLTHSLWSPWFFESFWNWLSVFSGTWLPQSWRGRVRDFKRQTLLRRIELHFKNLYFYINENSYCLLLGKLIQFLLAPWKGFLQCLTAWDILTADSMQDGLRFLSHCIQPFFGRGHDNEDGDEYGWSKNYYLFQHSLC